MAHGAKSTGALAVAAPPPSNGLVTGNNSSAEVVTGVNRKKQKRRQKEAAKKAAELQAQQQAAVSRGFALEANARNGHVSHGQSTIQHAPVHHTAQHISYDDPDLDDPEQYEPVDEDYYTDENDQLYVGHYGHANGHGYDNHGQPAGKKARKKARQTIGNGPHQGYHSNAAAHLANSNIHLPSPPPPLPSANNLLASAQLVRPTKDRIWNTSTQEERERIKEFWLQLGEEDRKSLVKIEKEAVLRKMKEQQKHSCSCTVCGRKRTAIEEELEVLYDAYYEELEQYANGRQPENGGQMLPPHQRFAQSLAKVQKDLPPATNGRPSRWSRRASSPPAMPGHLDDDDEDEESYSEEEEDDEYSEDERDPRGTAADFFNFGNSLTVKGGILTVADDLLKNDGKKFIEMMEQLAERRMQREEEAQYAAGIGHPSNMMHNHAGHMHGPPLPAEDEEYDEEEDEDYESQDEYEDEDDEVENMTEEQRMEEGRRMFQIFAARMFEQRVLTAYKEKVARERQQRLLEELEEEDSLAVQKEAKKARDAQKKKAKREQQKQAKAEEKARKDAEKAAQEAAVKAAEEKKREEAARKREEARKKKEGEKKAQEEERLRKEAERLKRLQEERDRQQEIERKLKEQKLAEKKTREDAKKKEREDREAQEKAARDKKALEDKERKEREAKVRAERDARERGEKAKKVEQAPPQPSAQIPQIVKRPSQQAAVALPPGLVPTKSGPSAVASPAIPVATPALPKAPTPVRPRQASLPVSHASSPQTPQVAPGPSKSNSPKSTPATQSTTFEPKTILTKAMLSQAPPVHHQQPTSPMPPFGPPPGMGGPASQGFGMPPGNLNGFPNPNGPLMPPMGQRGHFGQPMFPPQGPPMGNQYRPFGMPNGMNMGPAMPSGMMPQGRNFGMDVPPGFSQAPPMPLGAPTSLPGFGMSREAMPSHSRHTSGSHDKAGFEPTPPQAPIGQPIARPAPIQRPSSTKPDDDGKQDSASDIDDINRRLGSSALLDDSDEPIIEGAGSRRGSMAPNAINTQRMPFSSPFPPQPEMGSRLGGFGMSPQTATPGGWPGSSIPFPPPGMSNPPGMWGVQPSNSWGAGNAFGMMGGGHRPSMSRPAAIRNTVCQACRTLSLIKPTPDGFHDIVSLEHQVNQQRTITDPLIPIKEILEICETEGDATNGGGFFTIKKDGPNRTFVKYEPDNISPHPGGRPANLGEIGSPVPQNTLPAIGQSRFQHF